MAFSSSVAPHSDGHGDVFAGDLGAMIVHVQRESGVAHRTFIFRPWQVRLLRTLRHRATFLVAALVLLSWGYLAIQAVRVPVLTARIAHMELDATRLDTLQATLKELQARYDQVQAMLSRTAGSPGTAAKVSTVPKP